MLPESCRNVSQLSTGISSYATTTMHLAIQLPLLYQMDLRSAGFTTATEMSIKSALTTSQLPTLSAMLCTVKLNVHKANLRHAECMALEGVWHARARAFCKLPLPTGPFR